MENIFGLKLYDIKNLFRDSNVEEDIYLTLSSVLSHLGISSDRSQDVIDECLSLAKNYGSISNYERQAHEVLERAGVTKEIPKKISGRSKLIFDQIKPYLTDGAILDFGCGDGKVSRLLAAEGYEIVLADIYKNTNVDSTGLEFRLSGQSDDIPAGDNEFDNSLALTVFHHSDNPIKVLRELHRVNKNNGRVLVIESVYGVDGSQLSAEGKKKVQFYLTLNPEQQRMVNIFFDHFYNRLINYNEDQSEKANVPYNFNTPDGWKAIFEENGFIQERVIQLGVDQPIVPEYHTLHILEVNK